MGDAAMRLANQADWPTVARLHMETYEGLLAR